MRLKISHFSPIKGLSREMDLAFNDILWIVLFLNKGWGKFLDILGAKMVL
jgi:hypothetical protein